ncbi:hypothetical protein RIF29_25777 [Crotalaria pallida]|uniref:Uncharacterized protein n=1 Tax=Crotalaria pallida TaxID=3830 RepID=A0AAN9HZH9_CROPI
MGRFCGLLQKMGDLKEIDDRLKEYIDRDVADLLRNHCRNITARGANQGRDIQGIDWNLRDVNREEFRRARLQLQRDRENWFKDVNAAETLPAKARKECKSTEKGEIYYEFFQYNKSLVENTLYTKVFRGTNFLWSTTKHDVYLGTELGGIMHWSAMTSNTTRVLDLTQRVAPTPENNCPGNYMRGFRGTALSEMAIQDNLLIVGGIGHEMTLGLICKRLDSPGVCFCKELPLDDLFEREFLELHDIEIYKNPSGATHFIATHCGGRFIEFDAETFQPVHHFRLNKYWPRRTYIDESCAFKWDKKTHLR